MGIATEPVTAGNPIQYRVSFRQAASHRADIEVSVPTEGAKSVRLMMPVWTPGSYLVREYARHIEGVTARDGLTGGELRIAKQDKNHWVVDCPGVAEVVVQYTLYGREMGVRTNWIESEFAFLTGAATFITREDMLDRPHVVRFDATPQWPAIATSLAASDPRDPWTRTAKNFDELIDSPMVLGKIDVQSETIGSVPHHLASVGTDGFWDTRKAMQDVAKIVETEQKFWGEVPYPEYWFLNLAVEAGGGLEHDNSSVLMTSRWTQRQRAKYVDWLTLVAHEFFHAWNVRRLRPRGLVSYDYDAEQYTRELWIAEGITSYYDELFVVRAGLCTPKEYLERLSKQVQAVQNAPGRLVQSLEESSFDTWIKFYRPDENATNSRISYYVKGALVGLLLDAEIRLRTENGKSLDDCMRLLWQRHRASGYDNSDFAKIVSEVVGAPMEEWLRERLSTTQELDYTPLLGCYGLQWKPKDSESGTPASPTPASMGMDLSNQAGKAMVDKVVLGGSANAAGIQVGDELLGWDGYRITTDVWAERLGTYRAGDRITATLARRGKLLEVSVEIPSQPAPSWVIVRAEKPDEAQEMRWRSWLNVPSPEAAPASPVAP
jgi:predicted metalloprotease with PDZ domain